MNSDKVCAAIVIAIIIQKKRKKNKTKRVWMKKWLQNKEELGDTKLLKELAISAADDLNNFLRMDKENFYELLSKVTPFIIKKRTMMREPISPYHRLAVTLRFLASGNSFEDMKFLTAIAPQTIGQIVIETCEAINKVLKNYIKLPNNRDEWRGEADAFSEIWNFPHCIGAIDGKHVNITKPPGSGSYFFNYKKKFSIILMAVVNANYQFLMVHVGTNGRASDAGLFSNLEFFDKLTNDGLNIPDPEPLLDFSPEMPYVFVGDDAFPLMQNLMKPYSHTTMKKEEIIFNYRLSRARRIVENAFGILASRFRILLKTINLSPEKVTTIVLTCCYLHNFLREKKTCNNRNRLTYEMEPTSSNCDDTNLYNLAPTTIRNASNHAKDVRDKFCQYFNTVGTVPWQNTICKQ